MTIRQIAKTQKQVDDLSRQPLHFTGGVWTHSTTQPITAAGVDMKFNTQVRNSGIDVNATYDGFTVNTGGMFIININWAFSINATHTLYLRVNGITTNQFSSYGASTPNYHTGMTMKYLQKNHVLSFFLVSGVNADVVVNPEDAAQESPFLFISQASPRISTN